MGNSTAFDYDLDGRRASVTRPNGVKTTYAYDAGSQITNISHSKAGAVLLAFSYGYDSQGNRVSRTREDGTQEVYGYDSDLRLGGSDNTPTTPIFDTLESPTKRAEPCIYSLDALKQRLHERHPPALQ